MCSRMIRGPPPRGALEPGRWHSQPSCDPGSDHLEVGSFVQEMGPDAWEGGRSGSVGGTMTHEGDYVVLFIAKNKNFLKDNYC